VKHYCVNHREVLAFAMMEKIRSGQNDSYMYVPVCWACWCDSELSSMRKSKSQRKKWCMWIIQSLPTDQEGVDYGDGNPW